MTILADSQFSAQLSTKSPSPNSNSTPNLTQDSITTAESIYQWLPHRYPFALVDRILAYVPGEQAIGLKNVSLNEPFFQGHFPNNPIMPGVLIIEAMAQVGGFISAQMPDVEAGLFVFAGVDKVRFRRPVIPGDQLIMTVQLLWVKQKRFGKMQAKTEVNGELAVAGELMFSVIDQ